MKFFKVISLGEAKRRIKENLDVYGRTETVPLESAAGRRAAVDITASECLPEYDRSTVDGYAVKASTVYGASDAAPSLLKLAGKVEIGVVGGAELKVGEAVYVPTGGAVPKGADAMVMLEYAEIFGENLAVYKPQAVFENIIKAGDDVRSGDVILKKGARINTLNSGLLAALGVSEIKAVKPLEIAVISTGDEIVGINEKTQIGQIRDTNSTLISALCKENGFKVVSEARIKDGFEPLDNALRQGVEAADIVLISGGSSIGTRDYTEQVLEKSGEIFIHGIALKPGKPTLAARVGGKLVLGLPGHPMACLLTLKLLVIGAIDELYGNVKDKCVIAEAEINFPSSPGRLTVQPVSLKLKGDNIFATPLFYKSGLVSTLAEADGYALIPSECEGVAKGEKLKIYLL